MANTRRVRGNLRGIKQKASLCSQTQLVIAVLGSKPRLRRSKLDFRLVRSRYPVHPSPAASLPASRQTGRPGGDLCDDCSRRPQRSRSLPLPPLPPPAWAEWCSRDAVRSGNFCLDKYEASVWVIPATQTRLIPKVKKGTATLAQLTAASATQLGLAPGDLAAAGCPATGNGCVNVYAVSIPGVTPSRPQGRSLTRSALISPFPPNGKKDLRLRVDLRYNPPPSGTPQWPMNMNGPFKRE